MKRKNKTKDDNTLPAPLVVSDFFCLYETPHQAVFINKKTGVMYEAGVEIMILTVLPRPELLPFNFQNPLSPAWQETIEKRFGEPGIHEKMKREYDLWQMFSVMGFKN